MKKKTLYRSSIPLCVTVLLCLCVMSVCVLGGVAFINDVMNRAALFDWAFFIFLACVFFAMPFLIFYASCRHVGRKLVLGGEGIYAPVHRGDKNGVFQCETQVAYADISNMTIVTSDIGSPTKRTRWAFSRMPYLIIECKDGRQKAINVCYFSKKRVIALIDEIRARIAESGNETDLLSGKEMLEVFQGKASARSR